MNHRQSFFTRLYTLILQGLLTQRRDSLRCIGARQIFSTLRLHESYYKTHFGSCNINSRFETDKCNLLFQGWHY
jgi:hypothetical protein